MSSVLPVPIVKASTLQRLPLQSDTLPSTNRTMRWNSLVNGFSVLFVSAVAVSMALQIKSPETVQMILAIEKSSPCVYVIVFVLEVILRPNL